MASYLITGSSRGMGLAMARHLVSLPPSKVSIVFATARSESADLKALVSSSNGRAVFVKLDATNEENVKHAAKKVEGVLGGRGLDILINNAGKTAWTEGWAEKGFELSEVMSVNVIGVHLVTMHFLPLLRKGTEKRIANISSSTGTVVKAADFMAYPIPAYKISKAALNALTVQYALELEKEGFTVQAINPGWVKTELGGGDYADLTPDQAAIATIEAIVKAPREDNAKFRMIQVAGWETNEGGVNQYDGGLRDW